MKRLLYFCLSIGLLFYSLPYLSVTKSLEQTIFSLTWLIFALCTIGGNLYGYLDQDKKYNVLKGKKTTSNKYKRQQSSLH
ncbi:hypothetical protein [Aeribacillus alveayuensis]|uniref:Uncharacterized protein n=1 Tax=Aeribacillus alveayuensis TaxID=279215 RepID=A0ABT9VJD9_9BACI|nr:hypothetical protein [Bacillus alveayuensis]